MVHGKKERKRKRRRRIILIIIIRNGAKTISLQTLFGRLNYHTIMATMAPNECSRCSDVVFICRNKEYFSTAGEGPFHAYF
jgi:hypothetical protein